MPINTGHPLKVFNRYLVMDISKLYSMEFPFEFLNQLPVEEKLKLVLGNKLDHYATMVFLHESLKSPMYCELFKIIRNSEDPGAVYGQIHYFKKNIEPYCTRYLYDLIISNGLNKSPQRRQLTPDRPLGPYACVVKEFLLCSTNLNPPVSGDSSLI